MKKQINLRLIGIAVFAVLVTLLGITITYYEILQKQVHDDLVISAKLLRDTQYFESEDIDIDKIDLSTNISNLRVTWVSEDGMVLYDNDASAESLTNHLDRPEIREALENGTGESIRQSDTMNRNTIYYAERLDNGTVLRVATDVRSLSSVMLSVAPVLSMILFLIIFICIALSHFLAKQLIRPIEVMVKNARNADYESPYPELEPLAENLRAQHIEVLAAAKARQDFTANVTHELKTPLTAISGYAELLENDMVESEKRKHFYREIRKSADRLQLLINDIIRLAELDRAESDLESVDLCEAVRECESDLRVVAQQRGVEIEFEYGHGECIKVLGNMEMLKELTENLVNNAIRYNNPGGKVFVQVCECDGNVRLIVRDNGIGIPLSEQERIFERFYRVDKSRSKETGGTGLGLAIVKHIVELHHARILVDSEVGRGTTMTVVF